MKNENKRINVTYLPEVYEQIKLIADKNGISMSEVVRDWSELGLNGELNVKNIDLLTDIIREQIEVVIRPLMDRLLALSAKTGISAGTSAYLSAEAISSFIPLELQKDFQEVYQLARRKAVVDMRKKIESYDDND